MKVVILSALYVLIAFIILLLLNIGLFYFFNELVFPALNWFNKLHWGLKIVGLIFGGYALFAAFLNMTAAISTMIGGLVFNRLPHNSFTFISSFILAAINAIYGIVMLWRHPEHYSFWVVMELILLSVFVWSLIAVVLPLKYQKKEY